MRWSAVAWMLLFAVPRARAHAQAGPIYRASWWDAASVGAAGALFVLPTVLDLPKGPPSCGDRKSTRLNSSHLVISYAVFCLKKKKKQKTKETALHTHM